MKRNKLMPRSNHASLFNTSSVRLHSRRNTVALSSLAIVGMFITSIVLATNKEVSTSDQINIIALPKLSDETHNFTLSNTQTFLSPTAVDNNVETSNTELNSTRLHAVKLSDNDQTSLETTPIEPSGIWHDITVKSGDNLSLIFPRIGLSARDVYNVVQLGQKIKPLLNLKPGQILRFNVSEKNNTKTLHQIKLQLSPTQKLAVSASPNGGYLAELDTREVEQRQNYATGKITSSLFETGIEAGLSDKMIMELAHIFGWDIDFALDIRQNDSFVLLYTEDYLDGNKIADGNILAAEFTNQGKSFRAIRYTDDNGNSQYYSPQGESMRKVFSRTPVHFSRISSRFNPNRKHPILKTNRPHRGVDYAATPGTPILATGDGKIKFRGTKGGYGRTIIISHGGKYTTLYAHMSNFKRGLKRGSHVKQGQTIGFVGSSGLATGPHLHYEFRVNGVHHNPLTVNLPKAKALAKKYHSDFKQKSQFLLAQLDSLNNTVLALND